MIWIILKKRIAKEENIWNNNYIEYESSGDRNISHDNANEVVNELFVSLLSRYQIGSENQ